MQVPLCQINSPITTHLLIGRIPWYNEVVRESGNTGVMERLAELRATVAAAAGTEGYKTARVAFDRFFESPGVADNPDGSLVLADPATFSEFGVAVGLHVERLGRKKKGEVAGKLGNAA